MCRDPNVRARALAWPRMPEGLSKDDVRIRETDPESTVELRHLAVIRCDRRGLAFPLRRRQQHVTGFRVTIAERFRELERRAEQAIRLIRVEPCVGT